MPTRITTAAGGASLPLAAAIVACLISSPSAYSAPEVKIENKALADAVKGAMDNAKAGRFAEALAKAKEANRLVDLAEPKLRELPHQIHLCLRHSGQGLSISVY